MRAQLEVPEKEGWAGKLSKEALVQVCKIVNGDGHTIFKVEAFDKLPSNVIEQFSETLESSKTHPKGMIFDDNGNVIPSVFGIYGLPLIENIGRSLGLEWEQKMGRGFACRVATKALRKHVESMEG